MSTGGHEAADPDRGRLLKASDFSDQLRQRDPEDVRQVLGLPNVRGYQFDVQVVTAPVTDGSLSSCPPAEAVTWGKVDKDTYRQTTESMTADYSLVMPFLVKALLDNRELYAAMSERMGEAELFLQEPKARGYLRPREGYRLFIQREALCGRLMDEVRKNREWLLETLRYPLLV